jgi:hypothetical protein
MSPLQAFFGAVLVLVAGCGQRRMDDMGVWSQPQEVAKSSDSLSTSFSLYKWNGTLLALGGDAGTYAARVLEEEGASSWKTVSTVDPGWIPMDVDPKGNRFVIARGIIWSNRLDARFAIGSLSHEGRYVSETGLSISLDQRKLFPNGNPNLRMWEWDRPGNALFSGGVPEGAEIRIPYCIDATPKEGRVFLEGKTISANGVFASSDGGHSWRTEQISVHYAESPVVCRTIGFYYCFAKAGLGGVDPYELWYSRCPVDSSSWSHPETLNKSAARKLSENIHACGEDDSVHLCWLDARHEKTRFSLTRPRAGNYEVVYSHRKDSDSAWSKDVILSKGLRWAYAPSMSVEGSHVVVAWAGARSDWEGRNEWNASDVFYVTSDDGGSTWTKPTQVTDGFKSGITSGRPQVALHKGVIHLFYIQGKVNYKEVSPGMVKLNQPPWPINYMQRPFPKPR